MPNETRHFVLVSDTSTIGYGGTLYQEIDGEYRVVMSTEHCKCCGTCTNIFRLVSRIQGFLDITNANRR